MTIKNPKTDSAISSSANSAAIPAKEAALALNHRGDRSVPQEIESMNWRIVLRKIAPFLSIALALVLVWSRVSQAQGPWIAALMPGLAFGVVLGAGTVLALREGALPGATARAWPAEWKEVDVRDVRRHSLRAAAIVVMITVTAVVAPVTIAITADARPTLLVAASYLLFVLLGVLNTWEIAPRMIAERLETSRLGPPGAAWAPERVLVLRYPIAMRILMTLLGIPPIVIGVLGAFGLLPTVDSRASALLFSPIFLALGAYVILEATFISITFDREGIQHRSPWRRRRSIPWREVRGYCRFEFNQYWVFDTEQGRVRVSDYLSGSRALSLFLSGER